MVESFRDSPYYTVQKFIKNTLEFSRKDRFNNYQISYLLDHLPDFRKADQISQQIVGLIEKVAIFDLRLEEEDI